MKRVDLCALALCVLTAAACWNEPPRTGDSASAVPRSDTARPVVRGIAFDPLTVKPGTAVGDMVLDSIETRTAFDSTQVGVARFHGPVVLSGRTMRHPDADLAQVELCFEVDASAQKLPRWRGDERRAWFCFVNRDEAIRALGPPSEGVEALITVDDFTIHRGLSDEVNTARLVPRDSIPPSHGPA